MRARRSLRRSKFSAVFVQCEPRLTLLNSFYDFVTTSNLVLNTHKPSSTSSTPTSSAQEHTSQSHSTGNSEPSQQVDSAPISSVLPANLPSKIVPGDGAAQLQSLDNVTLVSMLFYTDQLSWAFLCDSSDTVAQIFQYGPEMVASVLNITSSDISNNALIAYQKLDAKSVNDIAAVYLMYVPTDAVDSLQQLVYSTKSKFYKQTGISGQIASQVDPSLKLNAFVSSDSTSVGDSKQNAEEDDDDGSSNKTTIVAVCASFGGVIALLLAALAFRHYKNKHPKDGAPNLRELQLSPDQPSPFMSQRSPGYGGGNTRISGATMQSQHMSSRPTSYGSEQSYDSDAIDPMTRDPRTRGISWYSGHYTDWDGEEPQTIYGAAISDDQHSPFSDQQRISGGSSEAWQRRDEGVRRLKTGQVTISRPTLAGNSLMI